MTFEQYMEVAFVVSWTIVGGLLLWLTYQGVMAHIERKGNKDD